MGIGGVSGGTTQPITNEITGSPAILVAETTDASSVDTSLGLQTPTSCFGPPQTGPSGTVDYGGTEYVCKNGKVFEDEREVGTITDAGDYDVTLKGADGTLQRYTGNVANLIGASIHGRLSDGTTVDIDSVGAPAAEGVQRYTMGGSKITCAGPGQPQFSQGRELKENQDIDAFGNLIQWHKDQKTGERDGYRVLEHAPANLGSDGSTVVAQLYNSKYPEQSYREFSNGTRVPWDGKMPELAKTQAQLETEAIAKGPQPASKAVVEALKKEYLAATGVPLNQGQLELVGYTDSVKDPAYVKILKQQGEAVNAAYDKALGRPPTTAERLYWVNLSTDLSLMQRGLDSINNPVKTSKETLENIAKSFAANPGTAAKLEPAGDLPAKPTKQGLMGAQTEKDLIKERTPLANPFVNSPVDAAAFDKLRAACKLRGTDITDNPSSANWAEQMVKSGTAKDPAFYKMVDDTIAAVRAAYQRQLNRPPTQTEISDWVPFTSNMDYNRRRAAEVLVDLQDRKKIDAKTALIARR